MKVYPVKQYNAIQHRKRAQGQGVYIVPRRTGWVACLDSGIVITSTRKQANNALERRENELHHNSTD